MTTLRHVDVAGANPYRIAIGDGLLRDGAALATHVRGRHVCIVSDANVAPLYARDVSDALQAHKPDAQVIVSCIPAGEAAKSLERFGELMRELADFGATFASLTMHTWRPRTCVASAAPSRSRPSPIAMR